MNPHVESGARSALLLEAREAAETAETIHQEALAAIDDEPAWEALIAEARQYEAHAERIHAEIAEREGR